MALSTSWDDQQAVAAIEKLFDAREAVRGVVAASAPPDRAADVWAEPEKQPHDLIERPGLRQPTRLTAEQQARTDYETMKEVAFLQAEYECAGQLLKAKYRNSGIDPRSLWVGPVTRALKYASPELQSVWARSGRLTFLWGSYTVGACRPHRPDDTSRAYVLYTCGWVGAWWYFEKAVVGSTRAADRIMSCFRDRVGGERAGHC